MRMVLVEWVDSSSVTGWHTPSPSYNIQANCISVGVLLYDNEDRISIAQSKSDSGNWAEVISIPKCSIKRVRTLKVK